MAREPTAGVALRTAAEAVVVAPVRGLAQAATAGLAARRSCSFCGGFDVRHTIACNNMTKHFLTIPLPDYSRRFTVTDCSRVNNRVLGYNMSAGGGASGYNSFARAGAYECYKV